MLTRLFACTVVQRMFCTSTTVEESTTARAANDGEESAAQSVAKEEE